MLKSSLKFYAGLILCLLLLACSTKPENKVSVADNKPAIDEEAKKTFPLDDLRLPDGFKIEIYAEDIPDARSMASK